jgi:membrane protein YdbS with pleckstrin-like domain
MKKENTLLKLNQLDRIEFYLAKQYIGNKFIDLNIVSVFSSFIYILMWLCLFILLIYNINIEIALTILRVIPNIWLLMKWAIVFLAILQIIFIVQQVIRIRKLKEEFRQRIKQ